MYVLNPFQYDFKKGSQNRSYAKRVFNLNPITIQDGELVVIKGPSGSGKSTLLQLLKGIIPEFSSGEFSGEILYQNHPLHGEYFTKNLKHILFLFQNPFSQLIYPGVPEEFFFSMENFSYTKEQMDKKKDELNKIFNLEELWSKKTSELSHGECQRLVLSSLLAIDPDVLLFDEPTAFLDSEARAAFYKCLKKIKGTKTIIIVDHHLDEILPLVDKVINVNSDGEISVGSQDLEEVELISTNLPPLKHDSAEVVLKLSHVAFHYKDQLKLLDDINLKARSSDVLVIKGKNGKGKSTLFKIMAGMIKPLEGEFEIWKNKKMVPAKKHYKEIGFIFQNPESHFFYDTINLELKKTTEKSEFKVLLKTFFSGIDLDRSPFLLSEGEKRRLSLLMTVFLDKTILLYDEPTFGQDQQSIATIIEMVKYLKQLGKIQIIISHDDKFIKAIADAVYELDQGALVRTA